MENILVSIASFIPAHVRLNMLRFELLFFLGFLLGVNTLEEILC
jgi:hypothetical protein